MNYYASFTKKLPVLNELNDIFNTLLEFLKKSTDPNLKKLETDFINEILNYTSHLNENIKKIDKIIEVNNINVEDEFRHAYFEFLYVDVNYLNEAINQKIDSIIKSEETENFNAINLNNFISRLNRKLKYFIESDEWKTVLKIVSRSFTIEAGKEGALSEYIKVAKYIVEEEDYGNELKNIFDSIMSPVQNIFSNGQFVKPSEVHQYSAIVGPPLLGKTQFSFVLGRIRPVFYFNLCSIKYKDQSCFECFDSLSLELYRTLTLDQNLITIRKFKDRNRKSKSDADYLFNQKDMKFFTIGLIWSLIEHSLEFKYADGDTAVDADWFKHYLKPRTFSYEPLSFNEFYDKMGALGPNFMIPIVFIDEIPDYSQPIVLLRDFVRSLVLPCVLTSNNTNFSKLLKVEKKSYREHKTVSYNTISNLPKVHLVSILDRIKVLGTKSLIEYVDESNNHNLKTGGDLLLNDLNIIVNEKNKQKLIRIWKFLVSQSKTCLQGNSYYSFLYFIRNLMNYMGKSLNSNEIWENICKEVYEIIELKQPSFNSLESLEGGFQKFRMFTSSLEKYEPERNSHYLPYYKALISNFALWYKALDEENCTVASVVENYCCNGELFLSPSRDPLGTHYKNQIILVYWTLANATHQNFHGKNGGIDFISNVVKNLQLPIWLKNEKKYFFVNLNENLIPEKLETFLKGCSVSYLVPQRPELQFRIALKGLCNFGFIGSCRRRLGMDLMFDILKDNYNRTGYVECKYSKLPLKRRDISKYIDNAKKKNSILTLFVSNKIGDELKHGIVSEYESNNLKYLEGGVIDEVFSTTEDDLIATNTKKKDKKDFNINVYCIHYREDQELAITTLREVDCPDGVFIVVESRFKELN